ncbi:putative 15 kDa selenoprotein-like, partial [Apostichopus japonicus]
FVKSDRPNQFSNLKVKYVKGADPVLKFLDAQNNVEEVMSIEKWNTDTVEEFLQEHLAL